MINVIKQGAETSQMLIGLKSMVFVLGKFMNYKCLKLQQHTCRLTGERHDQKLSHIGKCCICIFHIHDMVNKKYNKMQFVSVNNTKTLPVA